MPFIANTPESRAAAPRDDSLDPRTTCSGITSSGQRCKRPLAQAKTADSFTAAVTLGTGGLKEEVERYCWQHNTQARASRATGLRPTTSHDTLVNRLQILDLSRPPSKGDGSKLDENRQECHTPHGFRQARHLSHPRRRSKLSWLCCVGFPDDHEDRLEIVRHKTRLPPPSQPEVAMRSHVPAKPRSGVAGRRTTAEATTIVPPNLPSKVQSQLLQELSRPISSFDEDGYIYMYRQIDKANPQESRHTRPLKDEKILVKIGYATNVQSRLSAWTGRCGSKLELLRYYPHISTSNSDGTQSRKTPYCHRVERLIHIELAEKRVRQKCTCGSIHREWFEIEASAAAVKEIDEVIKKWVAWAERQS